MNELIKNASIEINEKEDTSIFFGFDGDEKQSDRQNMIAYEDMEG